jgi:tripartite-type tricarboxylate transporter receptor subunit TctC
MKLPRRTFLHVVGYAPGGITDVMARLIGQRLSERLGQQFIVENRPGAGGNIGTESVVKTAPDGYTLLEVDISHAFNATIYDNLKFNFIRDILPIAGIFRGASVLLVHPSFAVKSVPELISYAKANPGKITMATAGVGSIPHMCGELFMATAGVKVTQVHYRGAGPALIDIAGRADAGHFRDLAIVDPVHHRRQAEAAGRNLLHTPASPAEHCAGGRLDTGL